MDTSVTSIEAMAREFGETLFQRGFFKGIFQEFKPFQTTDVLLATHALIGVVLKGELLFQFQDCLIINGVGDQFFVPANTHYQVTAGRDGAQFLYANHCNPVAVIY
jgi:ethanolamine utilization protein EutQ (cupin superfamily)